MDDEEYEDWADEEEGDPSCVLCQGEGGWRNEQEHWVICGDCFSESEGGDIR